LYLIVSDTLLLRSFGDLSLIWWDTRKNTPKLKSVCVDTN